MVYGVIRNLQAAAAARGGWRGVIAHMYSNGDYPFKFGKLIGTDMSGNKYYENVVDYPAGQHRWCEPADADNYDASSISPEWHGWMHHMSDAPGNEMLEEGSTHAGRFVEQTLVNSSVGAPNATVGLQNPVSHWKKDMHNQSQVRERGFKVGNHVTGFPGSYEGTAYYTQPGSRYNNDDNSGGRFTQHGPSSQHLERVYEDMPEDVKKKVEDYQSQKK